MDREERESFIKNKLAKIFPPPRKPVSEELLGYGTRLTRGDRLTAEEAGRAVEIMIGGHGAPYETALFLTAFRAGLCPPEDLAAMARVMRSKATHVSVKPDTKLLGDSCGTGGDNLHLFNISTATMFILAAAGMPIAKHGNRASTSRCGSADVLEALGVCIDLGPEGVSRCIERTGIGFMFAPRYHPAMKNVAAVRKALPFRTVFNVLGPLCNPAAVTYQLLGVYDPEILELIARALSLLKLKRALVVCGQAGDDRWMDEVSTIGTTRAALMLGESVQSTETTPSDFGIASCRIDELTGGAPAENAALLRRILDGAEKGPKLDICLANAAAALYGAGVAENVSEGMERARGAVEGGEALKKLEQLITESNSLS
jgi:anthranilate phosphoribosyltransferase